MFLVYDQGLTPSALVFGRAEMVVAEGPTSLSALGSLATPGRRQGRHRGSGPSASGCVRGSDPRRVAGPRRAV